MRFLIDECCPRAVAERLRLDGHDVRYVPEFAPGATDAALAENARAEGAVIVTEDHDFGELAMRIGAAQPGVLLVSCPRMSAHQRAERLAQVVADHRERLRGRLTVVEPQRVRQRDLS